MAGTLTFNKPYDLLNVSIANPDDTEELALTIAGKKKKLSKQHFIDFGLSLDLNEKQIKGVFKRFKKLLPKAVVLINGSFLSKEMQEKYNSVLKTKSDILLS